MSDAITKKLGAEGDGTISGQLMLFECMDICVLSPAHECETGNFVGYILIII